MNIIKRDRDIIFMPAVHLYTIVWLHGLGDSAKGFVPLFEPSPLLENCKVVLLTAPMHPVTINGGSLYNSWYDFKTIDDEYDPSIEESVDIVIRVLEEERALTNTLILGGLSQGAVTSLYTGLAKYKGKLEAIIALSGYAVPMTIPEERKSSPVLMYHGALDTLLTLGRAQRTMQRHLAGTNLAFHIDPNLGHSISMNEWDFVKRWLTETVSAKVNSGSKDL